MRQPTESPYKSSPRIRDREPNIQAPVATPPKKRKPLIRWLALPVVVLGVAVGVWYWIYSSQFEATDDAYITAHEHPVSFRVAGTISEVLVDDNQLVKQGEPIANLDPKDYQVALTQARASLQQAEAQLAQSRAAVIQSDAQLTQAKAQADSAKAQDTNPQRNYQRSHQLFYQGKGVISKQDLDNAQYQFEGNDATYKATEAAVNVAQANIETAKAQEQAATNRGRTELLRAKLSYSTDDCAPLVLRTPNKLIACLLPAFRAMRVNPIEVLRE